MPNAMSLDGDHLVLHTHILFHIDKYSELPDFSEYDNYYTKDELDTQIKTLEKHYIEIDTDRKSAKLQYLGEKAVKHTREHCRFLHLRKYVDLNET